MSSHAIIDLALFDVVNGVIVSGLLEWNTGLDYWSNIVTVHLNDM